MSTPEPLLSIVIPVFNDAKALQLLLNDLAPIVDADVEVIVVDGGSGDASRGVAAESSCKVIDAEKGRARQMNAGAHAATGRLIWFLHADTRLPRAESIHFQLRRLAEREVAWGWFSVKFSDNKLAYRTIAFFMNKRSCLTRIATGDQGIFATKLLLSARGSFPDIPLMEDIAISKKLRRLAKPICLNDCLLISERRWERDGIIKTVLLMWFLRFANFIGVSPHLLHRWYYGRH